MSPAPEINFGDVPVRVAFWPWATDNDAVATLRTALQGLTDTTQIVIPDNDAGRKLVSKLIDEELGQVVLLADPAGELPAFLAQVTTGSKQVDLAVIAEAGDLTVGWLDCLRRALAEDDGLAAATALIAGEDRDQFPEFPLGTRSEAHAAALRDAASKARLLLPGTQCCLLRRSALDLIGGLEPSLSHPAALLADFGAQALEHGLGCVLASDLVVERRPGGPGPCPEAQARIVFARHRWLEPALADEAALNPGPLRAALIRSRAKRNGMSVTVDARSLGPAVGGTQTYVAALVLALARTGKVRVRAVLAADAPISVRTTFADVGVEMVSYDQAAAGVARTDVVHRPQQVFTPEDLRLAQLLGERVVISQLDLISYWNPCYHQSPDQWRAYRRTTRLALSTADHVLFFSEHGRREAIAEGLVRAGRTTVCGSGIAADTLDAPRQRPRGMPADREFLLLLGSDYVHKNRPFALRFLCELRRRHDWDGVLVLAGPRVEFGSSSQAEREVLDGHPELAEHVVELGPISDAERGWLVSAARALLYPSSYEGFGLVPLEAAAAGRPCIYPAVTSLREIIDPAAATIVPWDPEASADRAVPLLRAGEARDQHIALLTGALARYRWPTIAQQLLTAYERAVDSPYRAYAPRLHQDTQREEMIVSLNDALQNLHGRVGHAIGLVDAEGSMLTRSQQRGLMRVASRRWLRGPLLAPFGLLGIDEQTENPAPPNPNSPAGNH